MPCSNCPKVDCQSYPDTHCVVYTGPSLTNLGVTANTRLDEILQKVDQYIVSGGSTLFFDDSSTIHVSGSGTVFSHLSASLKVGAQDNNATTLLSWNGNSVSTYPISNLKDNKVKVSLNDTTAGYLNGKIVAGPNIVLTELNDGNNESLRISLDFHEADPIALSKTITLNAGTGVTISGNVSQALNNNPTWSISHADTSSVSNVATSGAQVISALGFDSFGHVTLASTRALSLSDLGYTEHYPTSLSFNPSTGLLSLSVTNMPTITSSLDGRWSLLGHTHVISEITNFPSQTSNAGKFLTTNGSSLSWSSVDKQAQDAVGNIFQDTSSINFTYSSGTSSISAVVVDSYIRGLFSAGDGISYSSGNGVITNTAPDQIVSISPGPGISITGTYPSFGISSTITQYTNEMAQDTVANLIQAGTGISWVYNDAANTLTPTVTLTPFTTDNLTQGTVNKYLSNEAIDDRVASLLVAGANITLTYDDTANTLTIDATTGGGSGVGTFYEYSFKVGNTGAPADGATSFYLVDDTGSALLSRKVSLYIERYRMYPEDDYHYDPSTGNITLTVPLKTGQRVIAEAYPSTQWITYGPSAGSSTTFPYAFPATFP